jgi:hypothetical protein
MVECAMNLTKRRREAIQARWDEFPNGELEAVQKVAFLLRVPEEMVARVVYPDTPTGGYRDGNGRV